MTRTIELKPHNVPGKDAKPIFHDPAIPRTYHLKCLPNTDLWHKPPTPNVQNMSCYLAEMPLTDFHSARVTVKANWEKQYDQGGLVLFLPEWPSHSLWVKTGVEFVDGKPNVSTVAARHTADWSLLPMPEGKTSATIEIEREEVNTELGTGTSLWVYLVEGTERMAIREMTWVFKDKADLGGNISVGMYVARPATDGLSDDECLEVAFNGLTIR